MTDNEEAIIATIHIQPDYRFTYGEARMAKNMVRKGLLESIGNKQYKVTRLAENHYSNDFVYPSDAECLL